MSNCSLNLLQDSGNVEKRNSAVNSTKKHSFKEIEQKDISVEEADINSNTVEESELELSEPIICSIKRKRSEGLMRNNFSDDRKEIEIIESNCDYPLPKKRKKKNKNSDDICNFTVSKLSEENIVSKKIVTIVTDIDSDSVEILENKSSDTKISPTKKHKKCKKNKLKQLKAIKSILKCKRDKYSVKNVSFNENVSYRVIDPREEPGSISNEEISNTVEPECIIVDDKSDINDAGAQEIEVVGEKICTKACRKTEREEETEVGFFFSYLPNKKSPYHNDWVADQRQALRLKSYKNMLKNIKKHGIFRTTNLLSIRGYGNWGH